MLISYWATGGPILVQFCKAPDKVPVQEGHMVHVDPKSVFYSQVRHVQTEQ